MLRDLRHLARLLRRNPGLSATVILTLALGTGLTTAIFSVVYGVLLRPLPYANPGALITGPAVSLQGWSAWRHETGTLEDVGFYDFGVEQLLFAGDETARIRQAAVSANLLSLLGVRPIIGRDFLTTDSEPGAEPVVMLTDAAWRTYFGARTQAIGAIAPFDPAGRRVIGVLPPDFIFPMHFYASAGQVLMLTPISSRSSPDYSFSVVARLKPGATLAKARVETTALFPRLGRNSRVAPPSSWTSLSEAMLGTSAQALVMLFGAVGCLFLIACANVANLLFAKGAEVRREFAMRCALGASRGDVGRLVVMQTCILFSLGAIVGALFAYASFDVLRALLPPQLPRASAIAIDGHVLGFTFGVSAIGGAAVGILSAWQLWRGDLLSSLQSDGRTTSTGGRLRFVLLATEVALAIVLLCGAGVFARSFMRLTGVDLGFVPRHALTFHVRTLASRYPTVERQRGFLNDVLARLVEVPGVTKAGAIELLPVTRARRGGIAIALDGRRRRPVTTEPRVISPGYLETMSIGLLSGRPFDARDAPGAAPVAIVNEALAKAAWPDSNPIGQRIQSEGDELREVVGVVHDVRTYAVDTAAGPQLYIPYTQTWLIPQQLVIRTAGEPAAFAAVIRRSIHEIDSRASAEDIQSLPAYVGAAIGQPRFQASLLGIFAGSGLLLAVIGVAGVVAYGVSLRRRELGIRVALGATPYHVLRTVTAPCLLAVAIGTCVGTVVSLALGRFARAFLFEISPHDPLTLVTVVVVLVGSAGAAAWVPARRAARIDPLVALRTE